MILYNGASGGLGRYLALAASQHDKKAHTLHARLEDGLALERELESLRPGRSITFIHLAAMVSVPACETDPVAAHHVNVTLAKSTLTTILDWASNTDIEARVIYVSSGHVYKAPQAGSRVAEDDPTSPRSVYARTKLQAEHELSKLAASRGAPLLVARVFGLLAPQQAPNYVLPGLIERVRRRDLQAIPGLDYVRDYLDARDICANLVLLASLTWPSNAEVLNICSGVPVSIRDLLRGVVHVMEPAAVDEILAQAKSAPGGPDDLRWLVGDPGRLTRLTATPPRQVSLAVSIADAVAGRHV